MAQCLVPVNLLEAPGRAMWMNELAAESVATGVLTRRMKQVADGWQVLGVLDKCRAGRPRLARRLVHGLGLPSRKAHTEVSSPRPRVPGSWSSTSAG